MREEAKSIKIFIKRLKHTFSTTQISKLNLLLTFIQARKTNKSTEGGIIHLKCSLARVLHGTGQLEYTFIQSLKNLKNKKCTLNIFMILQK